MIILKKIIHLQITMRLFSFIWVIIIMATYLVPCSDALVLEGNVKYESVRTSSDHHHNKTDDCSPFCSCACCSIPTVSQALLAIAFHPPVHLPVYTEYTEGKLVNVSLSIWQPPQLG